MSGPPGAGTQQSERTELVRATLLEPDATHAASESRRQEQTLLFPADLFIESSFERDRFWSCVRTRPRWEKKFARWLADRARSHFLPVVAHETFSGRKKRRLLVPLFPGYVFVRGPCTKGDFDHTGTVVHVLHPVGPHQVEQLHAEIVGIWRSLHSGLYVEAVHGLVTGEPCVIVRGPLQGQVVRFERPGRQGRLVVQVELMGGGLVVEVPARDVETLPG